MSTKHDWTPQHIADLIAGAVAGESFFDIAPPDTSHETARRKWYEVATQEERRARRAALGVRAKALNAIRDEDSPHWPTLSEEGMPAEVRFVDDPRAEHLDYSRLPMPETWVPYRTPLG